MLHYTRFKKSNVGNKWQVGAQTVVELKDKKLRIEDALNATKVGSAYLDAFYWLINDVMKSFAIYSLLLRKVL